MSQNLNIKWFNLPKEKQEEVIAKRMKALGVALENRRKLLGMSQLAIAQYVDYSNGSYISHIENGVGKIPAFKMLVFANAYRLSPERFLAVATYCYYPDQWEIFVAMAVDHSNKDMLKEIEELLNKDIKNLHKMALFKA